MTTVAAEAAIAQPDPNVWRERVRGSYSDPGILALEGMERMRAAVRGQLPAPPMHHLSGIVPVEASPGTATFTMPASGWWQTPVGYFNAGVAAWVADAPLGSAIVTALPPGRVLTTSDLTMNYLRPASVESERLVGRARLIHAGRSLGLSEVTVEDGRGRLLAHGTSRCFLFDFPAPLPPPPERLEPWVPPAAPTLDPYLRPPAGEVLPQDVWDGSTGLEVLHGFMRGDYPPPPIHYLLGGRFVRAEEGAAEFVLPATEWLASPATTVYGGALALLADVALEGAVQSTVGRRTAFSPLDLKVNFVRPVYPDGRDLTARASVVHRGRTLAVATAEIVNADGKRVAVASGSALVLADRPWTPTRPVVTEEEAAVDEA